ncbi:cyclase family protein [Rhizobium sp. CG4]|uniref:cyclase family protein n=1 Tax=Rhizobium/Agrobacterium group TaxID=227290 RepID=UPI0020341026|nr:MULTISPECIES: cyclase family protein [Rhizobium/Agrobacterium group]MCM2454049.1 cyclase family protein [Rhizobium sp. CG4]MDO5896235.1 cyclase family protein [Agrobacterium sp. Azo12]
MCNACVINDIKDRMLSRRSLFKAAAAGTVTAAAATFGSAPVAMAQAASSVTDMTHELHEDFPTFFGEQQFFKDQKFNYAEHKFNLFELRVNEHTGTHVDAPLHFSENGTSVAEIPVGNLVVPLAVIDIREKAASNPDAEVTPDDIKAWISKNGDLPENACVAMLSGWQQHLGTDKFRNADGEGKMHFPGFHVEAAKYLLEESKAAGIAVDTLSLDFGKSPDFATHYAWLPENRWGLEGIANLDKVPVKGATLVVGAPKHRGGTGGPARVFTLA